MAHGQRLPARRVADAPVHPGTGIDAPDHAGLLATQSNGMAESFVKTITRDYIAFMSKPDARTAMQNLARAFEHYNEHHPHSALKYRSPREFRRSDHSFFNLTVKTCPVRGGQAHSECPCGRYVSQCRAASSNVGISDHRRSCLHAVCRGRLDMARSLGPLRLGMLAPSRLARSQGIGSCSRTLRNIANAADPRRLLFAHRVSGASRSCCCQNLALAADLPMQYPYARQRGFY